MEDGILVKARKPRRGTEEKPPYKRINTDVAVLELPDGRFRYITESMDTEGEATFAVDQALRAAFVRHCGAATCLLAVVAITDGARFIPALSRRAGRSAPCSSTTRRAPRRSPPRRP